MLPTPVKTWQYSVNQIMTPFGTHLEQSKYLIWSIKQALVSFASNPWVVDASCTGSVIKQVGESSPDLWTSHTAINGWTTGAYPWIVLRQPATNWSICWNPRTSTYSHDAYMYGSSVVFNADGTTTTAPTSATRTEQISNADWGSTPATNTYSILHVLHSTDGLATRVIVCRSGACVLYWNFERPQATPNAPGFWTSGTGAFRALGNETTTEVITDTNIRSGMMRTWNGAGNLLDSYCAVEHSTSTLPDIFINGDEDTLEYPMFEMGLAVHTVGHRGLRGKMNDLWWGSTGKPTGTTYPEDGSRQFAQFGRIIVPWNGTSPRVA